MARVLEVLCDIFYTSSYFKLCWFDKFFFSISSEFDTKWRGCHRDWFFPAGFQHWNDDQGEVSWISSTPTYHSFMWPHVTVEFVWDFSTTNELWKFRGERRKIHMCTRKCCSDSTTWHYLHSYFFFLTFKSFSPSTNFNFFIVRLRYLWKWKFVSYSYVGHSTLS